MSNAKDIRSQIKSIKSTQKITKAMQMVAASKMRRSQDAMQEGRPYVENILRVIAHLLKAHGEVAHPFFSESDKPVKKVGYIVVSTDRGLCGGLNINLFKNCWHMLKNSVSTSANCNLVSSAAKASPSSTASTAISSPPLMLTATNPALRDLIRWYQRND